MASLEQTRAVVNHHVQADPCASNVVAAMANFSVFIRWHHVVLAHLHSTHLEARRFSIPSFWRTQMQLKLI